MTPPTEADWLEFLDPACLELQRLHKKLRRWRNAGYATEADAADCAQALELIRELFRRRGLKPIDPDGRRERRRRD